MLVETAHAQGLTLEAWINPYRLQANGTPAELCAQSPALLHPNWVKHTATGLYLDPASIEVQQYLADSIRELCTNYAIDGIHLMITFTPLLPRILMPTVMPQAAAPFRWPIGGGKM